MASVSTICVLYLVGGEEIMTGSDQGEFFGPSKEDTCFFRLQKVKLKRKTV